jgi:hypothetical protein
LDVNPNWSKALPRPAGERSGRAGGKPEWRLAICNNFRKPVRTVYVDEIKQSGATACIVFPSVAHRATASLGS